MGEAKATAIIQVRMSSTRFPGKVLSPILEKPLLWHLIHRLKKSRHVDKVVIATSTDESDDALEWFCQQNEIDCVRASLENVLERFVKAMELCPNPYFVRICGDSPLIDPEIIDDHICLLAREDTDYIDLENWETCLHEGFSVASNRVLQRIWDQARDDPMAREHVTSYIGHHRDIARFSMTRVPDEHCYPQPVRLSVDTPKDVEFITELYRLSGAVVGELDVAEVPRLLRQRPDLLKINQSVRQKAADEKAKTVVIRVDASPEIGFGHVSRCLTLARVFRESFSWGVRFVVKTGVARQAIESQSFGCVVVEGDGDFRSYLEKTKPDALVVDLRDETSRAEIERWKAIVPLLSIVDDGSDRRLAAEVAFYPPSKTLQNLDWSGSGAQVKAGWDWLIMPEVQLHERPEGQQGRLRVMFSFGGSDPYGFTLKTLNALSGVNLPVDLNVVLGPGFQNKGQVEDLLGSHFPNANLLENVSNLPDLVHQMDVLVCASGMTVYEAAMVGTPCFFYALHVSEVEAFQAICETGGAVCLGVGEQLGKEEIKETLASIFTQQENVSAMRDKARNLIDGEGARRIVKTLVDMSV